MAIPSKDSMPDAPVEARIITGLFVRFKDGLVNGAHIEHADIGWYPTRDGLAWDETPLGLSSLAPGDLEGVLEPLILDRMELTELHSISLERLAAADAAHDEAVTQLVELRASVDSLKAAHHAEVAALSADIADALNTVALTKADAHAAKEQAAADQIALAAVIGERDKLRLDLAEALSRIPETPPLTAEDVQAMIRAALPNG